MRERARRLAATAVITATLTTAGCDYVCSVERRAPGVGIVARRIESALTADPAIEVTRPDPIDRGDDPLCFCCRRKEVTANVSRDLFGLRVSVCSLNRPVSPTELPIWTERVEYVCTRISAACPEVGPWTNADSLEPPSMSWLSLAGLACLALSAGGLYGVIWLLVRARDARRPAA